MQKLSPLIKRVLFFVGNACPFIPRPVSLALSLAAAEMSGNHMRVEKQKEKLLEHSV